MRSAETLRDVIALGLILATCSLQESPRELPTEEIRSPIEAWLGQNVTIPCAVAKAANWDLDLNVSAVAVRWSKKLPNGSETNVYKYSNLNHTQERPGSLIDEKELKRGNASLTLHHVQGNDGGEYTCTIFIFPHRASAKSTVTVLAKPNIMISTTELAIEPGREKSVICEVSRFYPKGVKIQWVKHSRHTDTSSLLEKPSYRTEPEENSDGSYNVSSQLVVAPSCPEENGDVYHCVVTHASFSPDQNVSVTLIIEELNGDLFFGLNMKVVLPVLVALAVALACLFLTGSPEVSEIFGVDDFVHRKRSTLVFMVSGFRQKNIEIHLYIKRGESKEKLRSWKYPLPQPSIQYKGDHQKEKSSTPVYSKVGFSLESEIQSLTLRGSCLSYSCLCSTHITPDKDRDEGAELSVEVIRATKSFHFIGCQKMEISKDEPEKSNPFRHEKHQDGQ